jgi:4-hydroxy-2-oxoheptanedioate aldolase
MLISAASAEERGGAVLARSLRDPREELLGTVVSTADAVFAEIAASRFDLVWIDLEHSALSPRDVQALVIAATAGGAFSLIRLAGPDPRALGALLDTGADGVVLPRAERADEVEALAHALQFPPRGGRGYAPRRAALAAGVPGPGERPACIVQVESTAAIENAGALAAVDVCDALVVGTSDLSFDLGAPMELHHPSLVEAIAAIRSAATAAGKGWGVAAGGATAALRRLAGEPGGTLIYASDVRLFAEAVDARARALRDGAP